MSNSTQNDEIGKMERAINEGFAESEKFLKGMKTPFDKSSTQNNHETHTACIERIKKEGASATCCHCNPHDGCTLEMKPTQNDWEVRFNDRFLNNWGTLLDIKHFIRKELADARREGHPTITCDYDIEFMKHDREFEIESLKKTCKHCGVIRGVKLHEDTDSHDRYQVGYNKAIDDVLATLREEEHGN